MHTYTQNQRIVLEAIHHSHIPLGARFLFSDENTALEEYVLCQPMPNMICLIDINDGGRWEDPVHDKQFCKTGKVALEIAIQCAECIFDDMQFSLRIPDGLTLDQYLA